MRIMEAIAARLSTGDRPPVACDLHLHERPDTTAMPYAVIFSVSSAGGSTSLSRSHEDLFQVSVFSDSATKSREILEAITDWLESEAGFVAHAESLVVVTTPTGVRLERTDKAFHALCELTAIFNRERPGV